MGMFTKAASSMRFFASGSRFFPEFFKLLRLIFNYLITWVRNLGSTVSLRFWAVLTLTIIANVYKWQEPVSVKKTGPTGY